MPLFDTPPVPTAIFEPFLCNLNSVLLVPAESEMLAENFYTFLQPNANKSIVSLNAYNVIKPTETILNTLLKEETQATEVKEKKVQELFNSNPELIKDLVETIKGEIIIKYYPARTITSHTIQAHVQQMASLGFKPDLIIVDYADLMSANARTDARYQELGAVYEELRGLAGELQVPIWTASQTQRSALQDGMLKELELQLQWIHHYQLKL